MKADFIALDIDQPHFYPQSDLISHLAYSASGRDVVHVWVDGRQVVKGGVCTLMDEEKIKHEAQACYSRLTGN